MCRKAYVNYESCQNLKIVNICVWWYGSSIHINFPFCIFLPCVIQGDTSKDVIKDKKRMSFIKRKFLCLLAISFTDGSSMRRKSKRRVKKYTKYVGKRQTWNLSLRWINILRQWRIDFKTIFIIHRITCIKRLTIVRIQFYVFFC